MDSWKRNFWILWTGVILCSASYTMSVPFLPLYLFDLGVDGQRVHLWAGLVISSSFLMGAIMGPFWGAMADRYGKKRMIVRAGISIAVIYSLFAIVRNPWELVGVRLLHGFVSGFVPASFALVASTTPKEQMNWSLGMMQSGSLFGGILGPLLGGMLASLFGMRPSFVAATMVILLAVLAVFFFVREDDRTTISYKVKNADKIGQPTKLKLDRALMFLLTLLFINQMAINALQPIITLHIAELKGGMDGSVLSSGLVFSAVGIAGMIASPIWGRYVFRFGSRRVLQAGLFVAGFLIFVQVWVQTIWFFTVLQFMFGFFIAAITPTVNTLIVRHTSEDAHGRSFGLTTSANQFGGMIGPLLSGTLGIWWGEQWVFAAIGFLLAITGGMISFHFPFASYAGESLKLRKEESATT